MLRRSLQLLILLFPCACATAQRPLTRPGIVPIEIATPLGTINAELDSAHAPVTVTNFLRYVDGHLFDGGSFFRVVTMDNQPRDSIRIEVVQGGMRRDSSVQAFPAIPLERTSVTGLHHGNGTLSMARGGPDSA
ncbi:MAG: peptidylprolyl isomerase, partial [bacterium]